MRLAVFEGVFALSGGGLRAILTDKNYTPMPHHQSLEDIPRCAIVAGPISVRSSADVARGVPMSPGCEPCEGMNNVFYQVYDDNQTRLIFTTSAQECASLPRRGSKEQAHGQHSV